MTDAHKNLSLRDSARMTRLKAFDTDTDSDNPEPDQQPSSSTTPTAAGRASSTDVDVMDAAMPASVPAQVSSQYLETAEIAIYAPKVRLQLEIQDTEGMRRIDLSATTTLTIGARRGQGVDLRVRDRTVSAKHCVITVHAGGIKVKDLASRNGTYVGGARINEVWCRIGVMIMIGQTSIVCLPHVDEERAGAGGEGGEAALALSAPLPGIAGASKAMCRVASSVRRFAKLRAPVLIAGETGVGKELIARALHTHGSRSAGPFVAINASALPRELVESELFGHEKGAFTGAVSRRQGAFEIAEGGTLFLDEIGELPLEAQPKLLRVLDGYEVRPVGSMSGGWRADVRVVFATHVPLEERVRLGLFRRDLFHRLAVLVIHVPPLRDRPGDVLPIARALLMSMRDDVGERDLTPAAVAYLASHKWSGNVRELRNVLTRAAEVTEGKWIDSDAVHRGLFPEGALLPLHPDQQELSGNPVSGIRPLGTNSNSIRSPLDPDEAEVLLARNHGNVSAAARAASVPRSTFRKALVRGEKRRQARTGRKPSG